MNKYVWIIGALIIIIGGFFLFRSCNHQITPTTQQTVTAGAVTTPTAAEEKIMAGATEAINIPHKKPPLGYTEKVTVLETTSPTTKVDIVYTPTLAWGVKNKLGLYIGVGLDGLDGGLKWTPFYVWRVNLDLMAGYPSISAGISYQLLDNTYLGIGDGYDYLKLQQQPSIYVSLNF